MPASPKNKPAPPGAMPGEMAPLGACFQDLVTQLVQEHMREVQALRAEVDSLQGFEERAVADYIQVNGSPRKVPPRPPDIVPVLVPPEDSPARLGSRRLMEQAREDTMTVTDLPAEQLSSSVEEPASPVKQRACWADPATFELPGNPDIPLKFEWPGDQVRNTSLQSQVATTTSSTPQLPTRPHSDQEKASKKRVQVQPDVVNFGTQRTNDGILDLSPGVITAGGGTSRHTSSQSVTDFAGSLPASILSRLGPRTYSCDSDSAAGDPVEDDKVSLNRRFSDTSAYKKQQEIRRATLQQRWEKLSNDYGIHEGDDNRASLFLQRLVRHEWFDFFVFAVVIFNAAMVGAQVQWEASRGQNSFIFDAFEIFAAAIFTLELFARVLAFGRGFCNKRDCKWHAFDVFLVLISWIDLSLTWALGTTDTLASTSFMGKLLRIIRIARVMRIIRTLRFLVQLRVMAHMIINSMLSLLWITVILIAIIYTFAVVLTQGATNYLHLDPPPHDYAEVDEAFGTLWKTMYSLFKAMTGGRNWGELSDLLFGPGSMYVVILIAYILLAVFAVVNIVTGVFVDGAIEYANRDRTILMQKQAREREATSAHLLALLQAMDGDGNGFITKEEFKESILHPGVQELMDALQIGVSDAEGFFALLDRDGNGEVDIVEFVEGMQKLAGDAKSSDIQLLMMANTRVMYMCSNLMRMVRSVKKSQDAFSRQKSQDAVASSNAAFVTQSVTTC